MKNFPLKDLMDANISKVKFIRCSGFLPRRFHIKKNLTLNKVI
jgi:hypothetical protein